MREIFVCSRCGDGFEFSDRFALSRHINRTHLKSEQKSVLEWGSKK